MLFRCCCAYVLLRLGKNIFTFIWWFVNLYLHLSIINLKRKTMLNREEQKMYPKTMIIKEFPIDADTRDEFLSIGGWEKVVNNRREESSFYENLCHESNYVLKVKLPNGVIK